MKRNIFAVLFAFIFVVCIGCFNVFGADTGDFSVLGDSGYAYKSNTLVITEGGSYEITMKNGVSSTDRDKIKIISDEDVSVTIKDLNISNSKASPFEIDAEGDVTLYIEGDNSLYTGSAEYAALQKTSQGNILKITSSYGDGSEKGKLKAEVINTGSGAGIGGDHSTDGTNILIAGGTINAVGGMGAGIGGGEYGDGSYINITGGNVTAVSNSGGAGIGGGRISDGKYITVTGGTVNAITSNGAAIGGGRLGYCSDIRISGGRINITAGENGVGIGGSGQNSSVSSHIYINGGYININADEKGAAFGSLNSYIIEGGCFGEGNTEDGTVYGVSISDLCSLEANTDSEKAIYPYRVICTGKTFVSYQTEFYSEAEKTQLTRSRYLNSVSLTDGSMLLNYYDGKSSVKVPSVIVKPDRSLAFKPGKYYIVYKKDENYYSAAYPSSYFPQNPLGDLITVCDIDTDLYGITDMDGNIKVDCTYSLITPFYGNFFTAERTENGAEITDILNGETGKILYSFTKSENVTADYFISEDNKNMGVCLISDTEGAKKSRFEYVVFDCNGNVVKKGKAEDPQVFDGSNSAEERSVLDFMLSQTGITFYFVYDDFSYDEYSKSGTAKYAYSQPDYNEASKNSGLKAVRSRIADDNSLYGVFKMLSDGETAENYLSKEEPSEWAAESIEKLTEAGILFNEDNCFYSDNISRADFAYIAADVFCKSQYTDIFEYIRQNGIEAETDRNSFSDTSDVYAAFADYMGIIEPTSETTFSPAKGISYDEAVTMLNSLADLLGVNISFTTADFTETDSPALSREQAYVCLCRIYEAAASQ
ncbi:MAG: carbohydrate-binding domain-containing protein [Eubacterium sp.]|nr:carbohydrate-binding domain-containing protein [Eubacterium sp.]